MYMHHIHIDITISEKSALNLKGNGEGCIRKFGGKKGREKCVKL